ncbi:MAG: sugar phosphate isomerase/epimerase family protein [Rubrimonas sp.]
MSHTPPVIGAALTVETLSRLRNWIFDSARNIEIQDFYAPEVLDGDWRPLTDRYAQMLRGHRGRIGIHGPFWDLPIDAMDPLVVGALRRRFDQGLDVCAAVGADMMVIHSPYTTWDAHNLDGYPGGREAKIARVLENLRPVVARAQDQGVTLAIENIQDIDPRDRLTLAAAFDSPAVRLSVDTGHAHYAHGRTGAPPVDYFIRAAGPALAHVHLQDADGHADRHWRLGEGSIHWPSVFRALGELPALPRLLVEMADETQIVASVDHLAALGLGR